MMAVLSIKNLCRPQPKQQHPCTCDVFGRPLEHLRISVTDQCDLRCAYCFPSEEKSPCFLNQADLLGFDEIIRLARQLVELGVRKVKITGGEPLLRPGVTNLIKRLSALPGLKDLSLTTNGSRLADLAKPLRDAGLSRLTVSLDTLDTKLYSRLTGGRGDLARVLQGITAAQAAGFGPLKINAVIQKGINDHQVLEMAQWARAQGLYLRFIEVMDVGTLVPWDEGTVFPNRLIKEQIHAVHPIRALDYQHGTGVAERYVYLDRQGELGLISSVTHPFCGDCGRMRLSCDGKLYKCLFSEEPVNVRPAGKQLNDAQLKNLLRRVWSGRDDRYSENRSFFRSLNSESKRVEMYRIGG